jgi:hypothetical protein
VSDGTRYAYEAGVGLSADGSTALVAWIQDTNLYDPNKSGGGPTNPNAWARSWKGGAWGAAALIGNALADYTGTERIDLAVNSGGDAAAVWEESRIATSATDPSWAVVVNRFTAASGTWIGPFDAATAADNISWPDIGIAPSGDVALVWNASREDVNDGWFRRFDAAGAGWAPAEQVEAGVLDARFIRADVDDEGSAWVLGFRTGASLGAGSWARRRGASGWDPEEQVGNGEVIAMDAAGAGWVLAVVAQSRYDGSGPSFLTSAWGWAHTP